eukprot:1561774-Rhodomonas_salina.3
MSAKQRADAKAVTTHHAEQHASSDKTTRCTKKKPTSALAGWDRSLTWDEDEHGDVGEDDDEHGCNVEDGREQNAFVSDEKVLSVHCAGKKRLSIALATSTAHSRGTNA